MGVRRRGERGSALLIVLVMAAMIAIMLYKEMPVSAFEAQRQKEELLVERGAEYKHAIKLFVRKFGRFPGTLDELESTNRMRFLRRKYMDPLTGKDNWRLLHAGPGGVITDSKIKDAKSANASTLGQGATFAGFNNSIKQPDDAAADAAATVPGLRQRSAATANAGPVGGVNGDFPPMPNSGTPGIGTGQSLYPGLSAQGTEVASGGAGSNPGAGASGAGPGGSGGGYVQNPANLNVMNDPALATALAAAGPNGILATGPGNQAVTQQLNTQNPLTPQGPTGAPNQTGTTPAAGGLQNSGAFPQNGTAQNGQGLAGGGIAGVASIAAGKSIKTVNDQTKYSLWEFVFDLRKEQTANMPNGGQPQNGTGIGQNGANGSGNTLGLGSSGSGFGSSSNGQSSNTSSFGQPTSTGIPPQGAPATPPE